MPRAPKEKKLSKEEFLELELNHAKSNLLAMEKIILELKKDLASANKNLLIYMDKELDRDMVNLSKERESLSNKAKLEKEKREKFTNKVRKRLKIKGRFGYDPETLAVLED